MFFWSVGKRSFVSNSMGDSSFFCESSRWQFHAMMENEITDLGNLVCAAIKSLSFYCFREVPKSFSWVFFFFFDRSLSHNHVVFFFKITVLLELGKY